MLPARSPAFCPGHASAPPCVPAEAPEGSYYCYNSGKIIGLHGSLGRMFASGALSSHLDDSPDHRRIVPSQATPAVGSRVQKSPCGVGLFPAGSLWPCSLDISSSGNSKCPRIFCSVPVFFCAHMYLCMCVQYAGACGHVSIGACRSESNVRSLPQLLYSKVWSLKTI